jgi:hypothetical protein
MPSRPPSPVCAALLLTLLAACGGDVPEATPEAAAEAASEAATTSPAGGAAPSAGPDIWLAELREVEGGMITVGEPRNLTRRPGYDNQPHFLPDGSLLYTRQDGAGTDIWRWDPAGDALAPLTRTDPESEYSPTPLPGGGGFSVVRVEADSTQRLWRFDPEGGNPTVLLADVAPVGYHAWVSPDTVALFVLGDPATLQLASVRSGLSHVLAEDIGRSLQPVPGRHAFSYVQRGSDGGTVIRVHDLATGEVTDAGAGVDGQDFHAWTPSGMLLQASGGRLFFWHSAMGHWMPAADFSELGLTLSRLAVSPDGTHLALVAEGGTP